MSHMQPYYGDGRFLAGPTPRALKALQNITSLLETERKKEGALEMDTTIPSAITLHRPGYILSAEEDIIKGLQTDFRLKGSCKPKGSFRTVEKALTNYGYFWIHNVGHVFEICQKLQ
jgi:formate C-acetyltransferase